MYVIKRDGTRVLFDPNKIVNAINKAMISVDGSLYETETAEEIANIIGRHTEDMTVEYIQDCVEKELMKSERPDVAKAYILYRDERSQVRDRKSKLIHTVMKRTNAMAVENANANVDEYSFSGREKEASADIQKIIALDYTLSPEVSRAHKEMLLYQHDMEKTNIGQHNCFGRETRFITIDGVKSFYDFEDGDNVIVLNAHGEWEKAIVHNYGPQDLNKITLKNGAWNVKTVRATAKHTWLLSNYGEKPKEIPGITVLTNGGKTTNLKEGDKLLKAPNIFQTFNYEEYLPEELLFWCKGFALGDGTVEYDVSKIDGNTYKSNRTRVRLCGKKDLAFLPIFEKAQCQIREQIADNGDRFVGILNYHKEIPEFKSLTELYLFFTGLYCADGTMTNKTSSGKMIYSLQSSKLDVINFIRQYAETLGMYITAEKELTGQETNFGKRPYTINFNFNPDFAFNYKVSSIEPDSYEDVWCIQTEKTNTFVLSGGIPTGNCLFVDFKKLFTDGFVTRNGDIRPPSTFSTACQQVAVIFQCQSQVQFGGVGSSHLDYDLAPFVAMSFRKHVKHYLTDVEDYSEEKAKEIMLNFEKDNGTICIDNKEMQGQYGMQNAYRYAMKQLDREGHQSAEALYHNLNTLESRAGSQVPFTSINFGRSETTEGKLVSKWMLDASLSGVGKHHLTPIFPISIFQYKVGCNANPEDPNYMLKEHALQSLSKRIYPNFVNCDWSQAHENPADPDTFFSTMGCRTMMGFDRFTNSYNRVGRGNLVPNTMILPKLGIEYGICLGERATPDLDGFWNAFEDLLKLCEQGLLERFDIMVNQSPKAGPFMYNNKTMRGAEKCKGSTYEALKHGTLAIGYIGVAEMCTALFGKNHAEDPEVQKFALKVIERINTFAKEASDRNDLNFSCYATPAEGLCYTAVKKLREQYGIIPNVTDKEFLTNSHHVPVWQEIGIFKKLEIEAPFCKYPTGGCITYVELDSSFVKNTKAIEQIVDYAFKTLDIPYLAFNFPIDSCLSCGYQGEFNDKCPECGSAEIQQLRRVTGYLTTDYRNFNIGKQDEVEHRVKHSLYT